MESKNWRPEEGWENPYRKKTHYQWSGLTSEKPQFPMNSTTIEIDTGKYKIFEAGADAILDALRKEAIPMDVYQQALRGANLAGIFPNRQPETYRGRKGTLVFIPSEEA